MRTIAGEFTSTGAGQPPSQIDRRPSRRFIAALLREVESYYYHAILIMDDVRKDHNMHFWEAPLGGFDEQTYLVQNPDIADAVRNQVFSSGWQHFAVFGHRENRAGVLPTIKDEVGRYWDKRSKRPIISPPGLRKRVHGDNDFASFEFMGSWIADSLKTAINTTSALQSGHVLDFGCGCGRVITHLHETYKSADFYGTDIDEEAIQWCLNNFADVGSFDANNELPTI